MDSIESTVDHSAQVVANSGEKSQEIGQIVDTISAIADQTNLLALNPAIEAARAGEQGRGFAVVAEEVRHLAEQSQEAAKQIAELIRGIQTDTTKAVETMGKGTQEVKTGSQIVDEAGRSFKSIVELIGQVSQQVQAISTATEEQAASMEEIAASSETLARMAEKLQAEVSKFKI